MDAWAGSSAGSARARAPAVERLLQLPALVRPGPVGRRVVDLRLHQARVALGDRAARRALARRGERGQRHLVVATTHALQPEEEHREVRDARDLLRAHVEGGVAVEEARPVLVLAGGRLLVGDHADRARDAAPLDDVGEQVLGGHQAAAEARAQRLHLALRPAVDQRLVGRVQRVAELRRKSEQQPLPVALVRGHQQHRLPFIEQRAHRREVGDAYAAGELLRRQAHGLHDLHQHLREAHVVGADDAPQCRLVEGGKGPGEVLAHHLDAVGKEAPGEPADEGGEAVEQI